MSVSPVRSLSMAALLATLLVGGAARARTPRAFAPPAGAGAGRVVFTSAYTDFARDCRPEFSPREQQAARARGQDVPLTCRGPGGQAVFVSDSALASSLYIGPAGARDDRLRLLTTQALGFTDARGRTLEWRLANGRPFAAIVRVSEYSDPVGDSERPFDPRRATGVSLVSVGLDGFEQVRLTLDARVPDAGGEIRRRVDALYYPAR